MTSTTAQRLLSMPPADIRSIVLMMTDEELLQFMTYFRLGLICFLDELTRAAESPAQRRRAAAVDATDRALTALLDGGTDGVALIALAEALAAVGGPPDGS